MLLNVSYNEPKIKEKIDLAVGKPFTLRERWAKGGIGSPKLFITQSSIDIHNLLVLDNNRNSCNIELRPQGIVLRFRSLLETYAWVVPYYKLSLYKGKAKEYALYKDQQYIKVAATQRSTFDFFSKLQGEKTRNRPPEIGEL
ncbi:MAG: hypothetical protein EBS74_09300 [Flavobacteriia bacterium]|jgi:hypothetical protein|nr:hypothetical protein [Flavobacteriia bacterium]